MSDNKKNLKKVLIIGGSGFIGHNLALGLLKTEEFEVIVLDGLNVNNLLNFQDDDINNKNLYRKVLNSRIDLFNKNKIKIIVQDARDYHSLSQIVDKLRPDVLVHLAAVSHANISNKNPFTTFDHSLRTLENSLDCIKNRDIHLIYFSSSMVYGDFNNRIVSEDDKLEPKGIYAALKLAGELIVKAYSQVFDLKYTIVRPSALYGERCVSRRVTQIFIESALSQQTLQINGNGEEKLDFTYIQDLVNGVKQIIASPKAINEIFNLTYGEGRKIIDLVKILKNNFKNLKINFTERDKLNPIRGSLSIEKAKRLLNYRPMYNLDIGYQAYIDWYKKFFQENR